MKKISFIGYGNIAQALAKSLAHHPEYHLRAAAPSLPLGINTEGVATHFDNLIIAEEADVLILAVKPAKAAEVLTQIAPVLAPHCVIISVASGLNLSWLAAHCPKHQAIIRAMPNIAAAVMQSATPLIANTEVSSRQIEETTKLFQCSGIITWLKEESDIDIFTALSGSGPAYFFLFAEAMIDAGEKLGLNKTIAETFVLQTLVGASTLARKSELSFAELRQTVTSPQGTTAAAVKVLEEQKLLPIVYAAIKAAYERAKILGQHS